MFLHWIAPMDIKLYLAEPSCYCAEAVAVSASVMLLHWIVGINIYKESKGRIRIFVCEVCW